MKYLALVIVIAAAAVYFVHESMRHYRAMIAQQQARAQKHLPKPRTDK